MARIPKIAFEEHYTAPGFAEYSRAFTKNMPAEPLAALVRKLTDFDTLRLAEMDAHGVRYVILSQTGPGVQAEPDVAAAIRLASGNNDFLAERIAPNRHRFGGFAHLPMQDPKAAAAELERAVRQLGFKGALVNGHTHGTYYDDPAYDVFWERLQALDVPFYLHPIDPYGMPSAYQGHPELVGAAWGWGVETATHALRLLFGGVFDRFPGVKVILGHMGEGLPFQRWRFDSRFAAYPHGITLKRPPSAYIGSNIVITTSGVCSGATVAGAVAEMGADAVMFSIDYPYESTEAAAAFIEAAPLSDADRRLVAFENARRLFKLTDMETA